MSVALIDTSVFCNIIPIPNRDQNRDEILDRLEELINDSTTLLLPMAAVLEAGNHIAHLTNGHARRDTARLFCKLVCDAIDGTSPWTPTPFWDVLILRKWMNEFPDHAKTGIGLGDLSIIREWERQCSLNRTRRVFIWSLDEHLRGYDSH
ncbi:MAG: hypothetical protein JSS49_05185 [Planctomycetes bacterium]|nr:hypothetical protein [Planctomycetota bacterium]